MVSHAAYGDGRYMLSNDEMSWFWRHCVNGAADARNLLAAPLLADLGKLPPLPVTACEFDPLLDDSRRLVARLEEAGTLHRFDFWRGVTHACIHMTRMLDVAQIQIEDMAAWVREQLSA
jgi:acetyl esterase/lipase